VNRLQALYDYTIAIARIEKAIGKNFLIEDLLIED